MIIVRIMGGLGNQLFQYAGGRSLAIKNNTELGLDLSWYEKKDPKYRRFELGNFNINAKILKKDMEGNVFDPEIDGYWQSEKYFKNIEKEIRDEITLKKALNNDLVDEIGNTNSISVHIRHGDYLLPKHKQRFNILEPSYYVEAMKKMKVENPKYFVFSDDIAWSKTLPFPKDTVFIDPEIEASNALIMMSHCKHNIIANSSYSWWGAWLNKNPNKIIIAPEKYYNSSEKIDISDWAPKTWIKI